MVTLEKKFFKCRDEIAIFEVGHKTPENGCDYVFNPENGELELIYGDEMADVEGRDVERVLTYPRIGHEEWHDVDGITIFAKRLETYRKVIDQ
ncbi:hypothetical protein HYX17_02880 [Candidatus Woesearchaeota archaeon]|nr:hypothetical protein [Candidatus Woesearchaeota archaeon]